MEGLILAVGNYQPAGSFLAFVSNHSCFVPGNPIQPTSPFMVLLNGSCIECVDANIVHGLLNNIPPGTYNPHAPGTVTEGLDNVIDVGLWLL